MKAEKMKMDKKTLKTLVAEATKLGLKKTIQENAKPKVYQITRSQLAEGVKKALLKIFNNKKIALTDKK